MKLGNSKSLENLSLFCQIAGVITVFLGLVVIFLDLINGDFTHIQVGFFILANGYALIKISAKLSKVLYDESNDVQF